MRFSSRLILKSGREFHDAASFGFVLAKYIARVTDQEILTNWQRFTPQLYHHYPQGFSKMVNSTATFDMDCMYECRIGTDFLVKYKYNYHLQGEENYLHIEGPLAEITWSFNPFFSVIQRDRVIRVGTKSGDGKELKKLE